MSMQTLGFIGLGLIGGSIVKTARRIHPSIRIIALSGHQSTITEAYKAGFIENETNASIEDFYDCDCIFLCAPVQKNLLYIEQLKDVMKDSCILTDAGSVKGDIHRAVKQLGMEAHFIGGHPMAGSEKTGFSHATAYLLENAYYILTPSPAIDARRTEAFRQFIHSLGAIPLILDYDAHDAATAAISHLPHILAAALVNFVKQSDDPAETMKTIAAGGFRDITRIASSSPVMWEEICVANQKQILSMLDSFQDCLSDMRTRIASPDTEAIRRFFQSAKDYRDSLLVAPGGSMQTVFELYCDLIDEAGGIATIATILASHHISIKNIGILHNREFEDGVLKIELYDRPAYDRTIALLRRHHYTIYER